MPLLTFCWIALLPFGLQDEAPRVVLDADFADWENTADLVTDAADDAPGSPVDFSSVRLMNGPRFVFLAFDTGRVPINLQGLDGTLSLWLDADGSTETGVERLGMKGIDVALEFSPKGKRPNRPGRGVGVRDFAADTRISPYELGLIQSPTYASTRFEIRIARGFQLGDEGRSAPLTFRGEKLRGKFVFEDLGGTVRDETKVFEYTLNERDFASLEQEEDPFLKDPSHLRVVSWNLLRGRMLKVPETYHRLLQAMSPDIICFQELTPGLTEEVLQAHLRESLQEEGWSVSAPPTGGELRTGIASRYPLTPIMVPVPLDAEMKRIIEIPAAKIQLPGKSVLALSVHLKCCGRIEGREDRIRIAQASAIRDALTSYRSSVDAVVLAGDFNLVGSRDPLDQIRQELDTQDRPLAIAPLGQLDGHSNATWTDAKQPFLPGRLDWLLFTESRLQFAQGFVLDTQDLHERWMNKHELSADDTGQTSDHLPLLGDFSWR